MILKGRVLLIVLLLGSPLVTPFVIAEKPMIFNWLIGDMIDSINETNLYSTVYSLQNFRSRYFGYSGNTDAAIWLYNQMDNLSRLTVEFQGGEYKNVIATLPGLNQTSSLVYMVGAHYDSINSADLSYAPGATDNGGGVALVIEFARIMSQYTFNYTIQFAFWNAEEGGAPRHGSNIFSDDAKMKNKDVALYINFDSSCYDPDDRFILDIISNDQSQWVVDLMTRYNDLYNIGFILTYNVHLSCWSDHKAFWDHGYTAVTTHAETHGPAHSKDDTVDKVSTFYAKKNGQLCLSVLAALAEVRTPVNPEQDSIPPFADAGINQTIILGSPVMFDGSGSTDNFGIASYRWSFIDVTPKMLTGIAPTYFFSSPGVFVIELNVTDFDGHSASDLLTVQVNAETVKPIAYSGVNQTGFVNEPFSFDASGSSDNIGIVNYTWDFGDGTIDYGKTVTHVFSSPGIFSVILTVKDASGNSDFDSLQVEVGSSSIQLDFNLLIVLFCVILGVGIGIFQIRRMFSKR